MAAEDLIHLFIVPLNKMSINYMITGAVAASVYGVPRLTEDIDLVVELKASDTDKLAGAYPQPDYYLPPKEVIVNEISRKTRGYFNIIHISSGLKADLYLLGRDPLHQWGMAQGREIQYGDITCRIAPPEYVILRKLQFYQEGKSEKHLEDVRSMLDISGHDIDNNWLKQKVKEFGLVAAWKEVHNR